MKHIHIQVQVEYKLAHKLGLIQFFARPSMIGGKTDQVYLSLSCGLLVTSLVQLWWGAQGGQQGPTGLPRSPSRPSSVYVCLSVRPSVCVCVV